ncbi:hypothetical protein V8E36_005368 [Tilletia maclaganii]
MAMISADDLDTSALRFAVHARELTGVPLRSGTIPWPTRLPEPPSPVEFARRVATHCPLIIDNALRDRSKLWSEWQHTSYLVQRMDQGSEKGPPRTFHVALTPNGRADDLVENDEGKTVFALPLEMEMTFKELVDALHPSTPSQSDTIAYLQSQQSNLDKTDFGDFQPLLRDLCHSSASSEGRPYPTWASEAIGKEPEATNIWIGTRKSRSSMHRDHYENLFLVVRGSKIFTLIPPAEAHWLSGEDHFFPRHRWTREREGQGWRLVAEPDSPPTPWIPIDPLPKSSPYQPPRPAPAASAQKRWRHYRSVLDPLRVTVEAGQMLYLPSGWYHAVEQEEDEGPDGICLGLNWWWEAEFGDRWAWLSLMKELDKRCKGTFDPEEEMI